jgi:polyhydroxyalkanoate synthesis regulator phasin
MASAFEKTKTVTSTVMKFTSALALLAGLSFGATSGSAQALPPAPLPPIEPVGGDLVDTSKLLPPIFDLLPKAVPLIPDRPIVIPPPAILQEQGNLPLAPERPPSPDRPVLAPGVKDLVKDFQTARQEFMASQQELLRQLKTATQEQRAAIREQLRENLEAWREAQKEHIQELREQAKEMINNVPDLRDVINAGQGEGRGR